MSSHPHRCCRQYTCTQWQVGAGKLARESCALAVAEVGGWGRGERARSHGGAAMLAKVGCRVWARAQIVACERKGIKGREMASEALWCCI